MNTLKNDTYFITNSERSANLKERLRKLITTSYELKFLVGFFYFSGLSSLEEVKS